MINSFSDDLDELSKYYAMRHLYETLSSLYHRFTTMVRGNSSID